MTMPTRISDALSDHYRLVEEIGAGGMATVYLAEDLRHDRRVARNGGTAVSTARGVEGGELRAGRPRHRVSGQSTPSGKQEIWRTGLERGARPSQVLATAFDNASPSLSPDGHWLAYSTNESGRYEVYVRSYPGAGGRWQVSLDGGTEPIWSPKGGEI